MDDLQSPTQEHLRVSHTEERLQSFRSDRADAWGCVGALILAPLIYGNWHALPTMVAVAGVLATILLASMGFSWAWRKLVKRRRDLEE